MTALITRKETRPRWALDRIFDDFFANPSWYENVSGFMPAVDIVESDDDIKMIFQVPGMDKKDISIRVEGDTLSVSGRRESKIDDSKAGYVHREISYGEFSRSFTLPDSVDSDQVDAGYENGILEIKLTKKEEVKPKQIEVKVS